MSNKSTEDKSFMRLLKLPAIIASGISTVFLPENLNEICDSLKSLIKMKQAGNYSDIIAEEIIAIAEKLSKYKCISTRQQNSYYINV